MASSKQLEKQACFSHPQDSPSDQKKKKKYPQLLHQTTFKPETRLSILLACLNIKPGTSCPYKDERL